MMAEQTAAPADTSTPTAGTRTDDQRGGDRGRGRRDDRGDRGRGGRDDREKSQFIERVVTINRVSKVVKGGRRFSFTALVIVGDGKCMVGVGYGKAKCRPRSLRASKKLARTSSWSLIGGTVTHPVQGEALPVCHLPGQPVPASSLAAGAARC
jgi:small subunit ribosomal protein S5